MTASAEGSGTSSGNDWKKRTEGHPVWWAIALIVVGALGMWHLFLELEARVIKIANDNTKFPTGAVVAFLPSGGKCPEKWEEAAELRGHFIFGAEPDNKTDTYPGASGGSRTARLKIANLPPHRHQVYKHAGEIVGPDSAVQGPGSSDTNPGARVRPSETGLGVGFGPEPAPFDIMPPYVALTFCRPSQEKQKS